MRSLQDLLETKAKLERSMRQQGKKRGAYAGAVKVGSPNHQARARTGLSQADFAARASISERTLRTWERGDQVSEESQRRILRLLREFCIEPARPRHAVRYRDQMTGSTWSGRGLMPAWLRAEMAKGRRLADFEARA
ncbi:helix-turn-helix domain-containing protein [Piscinibacter aquaticus]|uniref:Helix-turn-helix domain-containing protein n=1 Tax=Piscinibacter aquaticus TaxID=392597 RepID=A0A5C6TZG3_9BURK|nr:helix-turn-helix domain-containing protein [Piscinibacter aquaticus]